MRFFRSQPFWPQMEPYFQISTIIQKWMSDLMSRLKLSPDMSVNIGDLFPNATMLNEYLSASLAIDEQTAIKLITGITMKPHRVCINSNSFDIVHSGLPHSSHSHQVSSSVG